MPTTCAPEEFKQFAIPRRAVWERVWVVMFGLEQLMSSEVKESNKLIGEALNGGCEFDPGRTHHQRSPKWPGRALSNNGYAEVKV